MRELALTAAALACGTLMGWLFSRVADLPALGAILRRIVAHLLEFRLFFDEPSLILLAQAGLIRQNLRLLWKLAVPLLAASLPFVLLFVPLQAIFGRRVLLPGESAIVSAALPSEGAPASLDPPRGFRVDLGPVRVAADHRVYWRIRPETAAGSGILRLHIGGNTLDRSISAGHWPWYLQERQNGVDVEYPHTSWMASFVLWSSVAAGVAAWRTSSRS